MSICGWERQAEQQTHRAQSHHGELRPVRPTGVSARKGSGSSYPPPPVNMGGTAITHRC